MRIRLCLIVLLIAFVPGDTRAQTAIGVNGGFGYSLVDAVDWLGSGVRNSKKLSYLGTGYAIFGRRYGTGIQVGLEAGLHRLVTYDVIIDGVTIRGDASAFRALGFVRFWFDEGAWFGEVGLGAFIFDGFTNPSLNPAVGTVLGDGRLQFPVKVRGSVLFDREAMVLPVVLEAGLQYQIGR